MKNYKKWIFIVLGTFLMAVALNGFLAPHNLVIGGATGISLIVLRLFNIPMWLTNLIIDIPLLICAIKIKGKNFAKNTLISTILLSFFIGITEYIPYFETDILMGSLYGGIISGIGLGLVFKVNSTTGGSDLAAGLLKKFFPHISVARIMLIIDVIVIGLGLFVLGIRSVLYAIIAVYIISKTIDIVLEGLDFAKAAFIISDKSEEIGKEINTKLKRGATLFNGTGMYTHNPKNMLIVVMSSKQIAKLKDITTTIDNKSFIFITDVREIMGDF
ncbi:MAG: YitT family protein [Lachnospirales bacterium]